MGETRIRRATGNSCYRCSLSHRGDSVKTVRNSCCSPTTTSPVRVWRPTGGSDPWWPQQQRAQEHNGKACQLTSHTFAKGSGSCNTWLDNGYIALPDPVLVTNGRSATGSHCWASSTKQVLSCSSMFGACCLSRSVTHGRHMTVTLC